MSETFVGTLVSSTPYNNTRPIMLITPNYYALQLSDELRTEAAKYVNTDTKVRVVGTVLNEERYLEVIDVESIEPHGES